MSLMEIEIDRLKQENKSLKETVKDLRRIKENYANDFQIYLQKTRK